MSSSKPAVAQFKNLWDGGYYEGNPLDPMARSSYSVFGFISVLHATYLTCIKPYVNRNSTVIEIGPGRGAWTSTFVKQGAKKIFVLDAAPPEQTGFWSHLGKRPEIEYITVEDFSLPGIPDEAGDYFFSYGVFCHIPKEYSKVYLANLFKKLKSGAHGFLMVGDFEKYNAFCADIDSHSALSIIDDMKGARFLLMRLGYRLAKWLGRPYLKMKPLDKSRPNNLADKRGLGAWHDFPVEELNEHLRELGFVVLDRDVGVNPRDPVVHFLKP